jgi:bifunctional UDP-N-acetylglucosamine pyrophosphorylase / glucosamine-1-phosphate N-acetyltransferase
MSYTLIIPAAGKGSRLGYEQPKVLFPIQGKPILFYLFKNFAPFVSRAIVITSPAGREEIEKATRELNPKFTVEFAEQRTPVGMVDAILCASPLISLKENILLVWGDQVLLSQKTISNAIQTFEASAKLRKRCVLPTISLKNPYIHFERDSQGKIENCRMRREGVKMPTVGESDAGFFILSGALIKDELQAFFKDPNSKGIKTGEVSFPPFFAHVAKQNIPVLTSIVETPQETIGLNDKNDLEIINSFL